MLDLGIDLNFWPWVWLGVAVFFALIELTLLAGSFVLLPFAVSALGAALLGFYDIAIEIQWLVFLGGGGVIWVVLYRYLKRFVGDNELQPGVGADRLIGLAGIVTSAIDPDDTERRGRISAHGDVWGATSENGRPLAKGVHVRIVSVTGTKVSVESTDVVPPATPPTTPPSSSPPPAPPSSSPSSSSPPSSSPPSPPPNTASNAPPSS